MDSAYGERAKDPRTKDPRTKDPGQKIQQTKDPETKDPTDRRSKDKRSHRQKIPRHKILMYKYPKQTCKGYISNDRISWIYIHFPGTGSDIISKNLGGYFWDILSKNHSVENIIS